jgi:hypothetical protein
MRKHSHVRLYAIALAALAGTASPALAQFTPRAVNQPVPAERYHIEGGVGFWNPIASMSISSESLNLPGDLIDFKRDLGLDDERFPQLRLVFSAARKHKFRFQYIPINYEQRATVTRDLALGDNCFGIVFNGQCYTLNLPVNSSIDWKAYRFGYEFDFLVKENWFAGFVLDVKYTDVQAELISPAIAEGGRATAPIPAIGGTFRVYPVPNISVTGEITGVFLPDRVIQNARAHYIDMDFYGTYNFTRTVGVQFGYRSFDVGYDIEEDIGDFDLRGVYFGVVARY